MEFLQRSVRFSKGEWRRQLSSKKLYVVSFCMAVILYFYSGTMPQVLRESQMSIGVLELFPLYWNGISLPDVLLGGFLLLVCDIPERGLGMRSHVMRSGRKVYYFGEMLYIMQMTVCYLLFIWIGTVLLAVPQISFGSGWSEAIRNGKFGMDSIFRTTENYLYSGTPAGRFFSCLLLVGLCCLLMAVICSVINMATGSVAGCAVCAGMLLVDIVVRKSFLGEAYPAWTFFCSPITTIQVFSGDISCPLWLAALYYAILIAAMAAAGVAAVRKSDV